MSQVTRPLAIQISPSSTAPSPAPSHYPIFNAERVLAESFQENPPPLSGDCCGSDPLAWKTHSYFLNEFLPNNVHEDAEEIEKSESCVTILLCCCPLTFPALIYSYIKGYCQGQRIKTEMRELNIDPRSL